jgi:MFS family permease
MIDTVEKTTVRKIYVRLLPLLFVAYFICYLDRINVGFAALTMNKDLGFTATVYALGATAFFWGYCLFEVPSNIILDAIAIAECMHSSKTSRPSLRPVSFARRMIAACISARCSMVLLRVPFLRPHSFRGTVSVGQFPWDSFRGTVSRVPLPTSRPCAF